MGELVTVVLPDLARRAVVDVRSNRLPPVVRDLAPRIVLDLDQIDGAASACCRRWSTARRRCARIDAGKLVYLRGPVPLRDVPAERPASSGCAPSWICCRDGAPPSTARDAPRFVEKLKRWRGDLAGRAAGIVKPAATLGRGCASAPTPASRRRCASI